MPDKKLKYRFLKRAWTLWLRRSRSRYSIQPSSVRVPHSSFNRKSRTIYLCCTSHQERSGILPSRPLCGSSRLSGTNRPCCRHTFRLRLKGALLTAYSLCILCKPLCRYSSNWPSPSNCSRNGPLIPLYKTNIDSFAPVRGIWTCRPRRKSPRTTVYLRPSNLLCILNTLHTIPSKSLSLLSNRLSRCRRRGCKSSCCTPSDTWCIQCLSL